MKIYRRNWAHEGEPAFYLDYGESGWIRIDMDMTEEHRTMERLAYKDTHGEGKIPEPKDSLTELDITIKDVYLLLKEYSDD